MNWAWTVGTVLAAIVAWLYWRMCSLSRQVQRLEVSAMEAAFKTSDIQSTHKLDDVRAVTEKARADYETALSDYRSNAAKP